MRAKPKREITPEQMVSGNVETSCKRYDLGKNTMRKIGEDAHAIIRIGKNVYYYFPKIDKYLESISE